MSDVSEGILLSTNNSLPLFDETEAIIYWHSNHAFWGLETKN